MITLLTGENTFLLAREIRAQIATFIEEHGDMALERLDGEEASLAQITQALQSVPFLASKKLVVLKTPGSNKQFIADADKILGAVPDETDVLIIEPKPDKRTSYFKYLKKHADIREFTQPDAPALSAWLIAEAARLGAQLDRAAAQHFVQRIGGNQQLLWHELEKLISYSSKITKETIDLLTDKMPQSTVFDLLEAALSGNAKRALNLYDEQRALKVDPQQILALLSWQLHAMALVKTAGNRTSDDIARQAKLNPYVVRKTQGLISGMTLQQLKDVVHQVLILDTRLKSESIDADEALKNLIVSLAYIN